MYNAADVPVDGLPEFVTASLNASSSCSLSFAFGLFERLNNGIFVNENNRSAAENLFGELGVSGILVELGVLGTLTALGVLGVLGAF